MDRVAALYQAHIAFVSRTLWRAGVPVADIDDLAHDVFLVVLRKLTANDLPPLHLATEDEERAWIFRIADFTAKNYRYRAHFRRTEAMDDRTARIPDARDEVARSAARDRLRLLLDSTTHDRAAVFGLVELEGYSVVAAARMLEITETNARRRLERARKDIKAAEAKLAEQDKEAFTKTPRVFLLPFGVGAWCQLRDLMDPPAGTAERVWQRLQATRERMEQENGRRESPPPKTSPGRARAVPLLRKLAARLRGPLGYAVAASGWVTAALLVFSRPNARIAILRIPVPTVVVTSETSTPTDRSASNSLPEPPSADATIEPTADAAIDEEALLLRQARAARAAGDREKTIAALDTYDQRFPAGKYRSAVDAIRAALTDAGDR